MPARRRIRTSAGDVTVEGGGDVVIETANVGPWGPDFGETAGSDGITHESTTTQEPLQYVKVTSTDTIEVDPTLDALALVNDDDISAAVDLDALAVANTDIIGGAVTLDELSLVNTDDIGAAVSFPAVAVANDSPMTGQVAGKVFGPPVYIGNTTTSNTSGAQDWIDLEIPAGTKLGDLLIAVVGWKDGPNLNWDPPTSEWTLIEDAPSANHSVKVWAYWKFAGAEQGGDVFHWDFDGGLTTAGLKIGQMHTIRGADPTTPIDNFSARDTVDDNNVITTNAINSSVDNTLNFVVALLGNTLNPTQDMTLLWNDASVANHEVQTNQKIEGIAGTPDFIISTATRVQPDAVTSTGIHIIEISPDPLANVENRSLNILIRPDTDGLSLGQPPAELDADGGVISDFDGYRWHVFRSDDDFVVNAGSTTDLDAMVLGAGGSAGASGNGVRGGGGGGILTEDTGRSISAGTYPVVVGTGGAGGGGGNSTFDGLTGNGGGLGGIGTNSGNGGNGATGGGAGNNGAATSGGTGSVGGDGGDSVGALGSGQSGGGGGGSVGDGGDGVFGGAAGDGGTGESSTILPSGDRVGGGGAGGNAGGTTTRGFGVDGGGHGEDQLAGGANFPNITGHDGRGGGGGGSGGAVQRNQRGGDGVVVLRYPLL